MGLCDACWASVTQANINVIDPFEVAGHFCLCVRKHSPLFHLCGIGLVAQQRHQLTSTEFTVQEKTNTK